MNAVIQAKAHFQAEFERVASTLPGQDTAWLAELRRAALAQVMERGLPTPRDEDWKYTRIAAIESRGFTLGEAQEAISLDRVRALIDADAGAATLVYVNGRYHAALSRIADLPAGVVIGSLAEVFTQGPEQLQGRIGRCTNLARHPFAALNTAFMQDGAYVQLAPGVNLEQAIHLVFINTAAQADHVAHPRVLFVASAHSKARLTEHHVALDEASYFTNAITEIMLGEHAELDYCRIQEESAKSFHIAGVHVHQDAHSRYSAHEITLGGLLTRNDVDIALAAPDAGCALNGLYLARGRQHMDNHTRIDHLQVRGTSSEYYKGVLDGAARSVFNGKVVVHKDAQKTDARQSNKNLLLSEHAEADTKPELEIYADDVKCAHGATVGQLDDDAVFFLRSRGLDEEAARGLLTYAFAGEIIGGIEDEHVRALVKQRVIARLPVGEQYKEFL